VPNHLREEKDELVDMCQLAGDNQHPQAVITAFKKYVLAYKEYAKKSKTSKAYKESEQLDVILRQVDAKCKQGSFGCATTVYQFLTDEAGSRRAQGALQYMSILPKEKSRAVAPVVVQRQPMNNWAQRQPMNNWVPRGRQVPSRGRSGTQRGPAPGLECWICEQNHYAARCPLNPKNK
jgi:hypothetical protein